MPASRQIVTARRELPAKVAASFIPAEAAVNTAAAQLTACVSDLLRHHEAAALAPTVGASAVCLLSEAAQMAVRARSLVAEARASLAATAKEMNYIPDCPDNESSGGRRPNGYLAAA